MWPSVAGQRECSFHIFPGGVSLYFLRLWCGNGFNFCDKIACGSWWRFWGWVWWKTGSQTVRGCTAGAAVRNVAICGAETSPLPHFRRFVVWRDVVPAAILYHFQTVNSRIQTGRCTLDIYYIFFFNIQIKFSLDFFILSSSHSHLISVLCPT